jgi:hypothetical protein
LARIARSKINREGMLDDHAAALRSRDRYACFAQSPFKC